MERKDNLSQQNEVLSEAQHQAEAIIETASAQITKRLEALSEELDIFIIQKKEDLASEQKEQAERESLLNLELARINQRDQSLQEKEHKVKENAVLLAEQLKIKAQGEIELIQQLQKTAKTDANMAKKMIAESLVHSKQLEMQKIAKFLQEETSSSAKKLAGRLLDRVHARYAPEFVWPKSSNIIEVTDKRQHDPLLAEKCALIEDLQEIAGVKIAPFSPNHGNLFIKISGGFGIHREASKIALEKVLSQGLQWNKIRSIFTSQCTKLEAEALRLGKKATEILRLNGIHPELQKLIGALNWRTSYRQNQWYHTIEVAQFASILAYELNVSPEDAKRVGLLHDIGKAIDYRIEGSHAVISGDYADRYGEKRYICDTVMSHHADLIIETPLAYVLQAADTLSGARPGARVNLEEGYQVRLTAIHEVIRSFNGIQDLSVMNGGREVHIHIDNEQIPEKEVKALTEAVARKIEQDVAYPGQIKILVTRTYESSSVA